MIPAYSHMRQWRGFRAERAFKTYAEFPDRFLRGLRLTQPQVYEQGGDRDLASNLVWENFGYLDLDQRVEEFIIRMSNSTLNGNGFSSERTMTASEDESPLSNGNPQSIPSQTILPLNFSTIGGVMMFGILVILTYWNRSVLSTKIARVDEAIGRLLSRVKLRFSIVARAAPDSSQMTLGLTATNPLFRLPFASFPVLSNLISLGILISIIIALSWPSRFLSWQRRDVLILVLISVTAGIFVVGPA